MQMVRLIQAHRIIWRGDEGTEEVRFEVQTYTRRWWFPFVRMWTTSFSSPDRDAALLLYTTAKAYYAGPGFVVLEQRDAEPGALSFGEW